MINNCPFAISLNPDVQVTSTKDGYTLHGAESEPNTWLTLAITSSKLLFSFPTLLLVLPAELKIVESVFEYLLKCSVPRLNHLLTNGLIKCQELYLNQQNSLTTVKGYHFHKCWPG
ncbi:hypothetical protein IQ223_15910 [Microcystis aeruginosa LEGE 00239]|nr:hypothetical protein [Microcystis aeruginosa LEGE 00239]NCR99522.1 hypothetical protein [Microcystis aeruginosa L311-01]